MKVDSGHYHSSKIKMWRRVVWSYCLSQGQLSANFLQIACFTYFSILKMEAICKSNIQGKLFCNPENIGSGLIEIPCKA
jgi:hypothetical protein